MEFDIYKFFGAILAAMGFSEMRLRWLKKSDEDMQKQVNDISKRLDRDHMTKDETLQMYGMLNQTNEAKLDAMEKHQISMDKKLDKIFDKIDDLSKK